MSRHQSRKDPVANVNFAARNSAIAFFETGKLPRPRFTKAIQMTFPSLFSDKSQRTINIIDEVFFSIDVMSTEDREDLMRLLIGYIIIERHAAEGRPALHALYRYCVAACLLDDPTWTVEGLPADPSVFVRPI
jgi:hypothetical protein